MFVRFRGRGLWRKRGWRSNSHERFWKNSAAIREPRSNGIIAALSSRCAISRAEQGLFERRGNKMDRKLILTGFMATGKSAVARALARRLDWPLFDTDRELASAAGKSVQAIFGEEGEAHFRQLEREVIEKLSNDPAPAVIATRGRALLDDRNHKGLLRCGGIGCL